LPCAMRVHHQSRAAGHRRRGPPTQLVMRLPVFLGNSVGVYGLNLEWVFCHRPSARFPEVLGYESFGFDGQTCYRLDTIWTPCRA
jgi:hypothetical protein